MKRRMKDRGRSEKGEHIGYRVKLSSSSDSSEKTICSRSHENKSITDSLYIFPKHKFALPMLAFYSIVFTEQLLSDTLPGLLLLVN